MDNLILNWGVEDAGIRTRLSTEDQWVPFFVVLSPSMRCNLRCVGCYSAFYTKDGELNQAEMDRIFSECKSLGAYLSVISGREPYLLQDSLLPLFRKHQDMFFLTFTNGTLLDEVLVKDLAEAGNVAPAISGAFYFRSRPCPLLVSVAWSSVQLSGIVVGGLAGGPKWS